MAAPLRFPCPALSLHGRAPSRRLSSSIRCRLSDDSDDSPGGGAESLFMKELKRRGMTPSSLSGDVNDDPRGEIEWTEEDGAGSSTPGSTRRRGGVAATAGEFDLGTTNQRNRSMALNSEGLEGLVPRAKLLLSLGGSFVLGFWPLMAVCIGLFATLYFYFGTSFVHDASKTSVTPPPYVDPYALLQQDELPYVDPYALLQGDEGA